MSATKRRSEPTAHQLSNAGQYRLGGGRAFTVPIIYWHLTEHTSDLDEAGNIEAMRGAFELWRAPLHPIKLESTSDRSKANILVHFAHNGDDDLPMPFDRNTLAYAYFPLGNKSDIWMNDDIKWASMHSAAGYSLKKVVCHEIGHSLNLGHSSISGDVMEAYYEPNNQILLTQDTLDGIAHIYASLKRQILAQNPEIPIAPPTPAAPTPVTPPKTPPEVGKHIPFLRTLFPTSGFLFRLSAYQLAALSSLLDIPEGTKAEVIKKAHKIIWQE